MESDAGKSCFFPVQANHTLCRAALSRKSLKVLSDIHRSQTYPQIAGRIRRGWVYSAQCRGSTPPGRLQGLNSVQTLGIHKQMNVPVGSIGYHGFNADRNGNPDSDAVRPRCRLRLRTRFRCTCGCKPTSWAKPKQWGTATKRKIHTRKTDKGSCLHP